MYKNYIFDLYGTLVDIKTNEEDHYLWEKMSMLYSFYGANYDPDDLKSKYEKYTNKLIEVSGNKDDVEINIEDVFFTLFRKKNVKPKKKVVKEIARTFRLISIEKLELYPYVMKTLKELKDKGKKLYLLSNAQACFTRNELISLGIEELFDGIYISSDVGYKKPSKGIFKHVIKEEKLDPKKTLMIGNDYEADIVGAKNAGIDSAFIKTNIFNKKWKVEESTYKIMSGDIREVIELGK